MQPSDSVSRRKWLAGASAAGAIAGLADAQTPSAHPADRLFNITDFGAKGDGKTLATEAVQSAVDACHDAQGGTVLVPAGVFVIGTVELKSNVTLRIAPQGKLLGSADGKQYQAADAIPLRGDSTLEDGNTGLIFAVNAENITVEGPGTIDGQGAQFRSPSRGVAPPSGRGGALRPYHLLFYRCRNLRIRDIDLTASAFHSVRVIQSRYVWMDGIHIHNRVNGNNDGFHFISSEYVHVTNCDVQSQDDACALFGSCRNVTVSNSTFSTRWSVFRFGGGNPENIVISNCVIYQTYGCPIKMHFGPGSKVSNIVFSNLVMHDVTGPISINLSDKPREKDAPAVTPSGGYVRGIRFQGLQATVVSEGRQFDDMAFQANYRPGETRQCIVLNAIGDAFLEDIAFADMRLTYGGGGTAEEAKRDIPQVAGEYFMIGTPPAYGLYARNVRGLTLNGVRFDVEKPDLRPAVVLDHVTDAAFNALSAQGNPAAESLIRCVEAQDLLFTASRVLTPARAFLRVEGPTSRDITVDGGDISRAETPVSYAGNANSEAVRGNRR
ncbi:MAG TPA: glycosyl hydrolase family 28 protein [Bryobacteraceae bacterium]|nr:glycosyl hydrolase family 28 protein [Bryobacteraceae bacterium]